MNIAALCHLISSVSSAALLLCSAAAAESMTFQTPFLEFKLSPDNGTFEIRDDLGAVTWRSSPYQARFGEISYLADGKTHKADLSRGKVRPIQSGLEATFHPIESNTNAWVRVTVHAAPGQKALDFSYEAAPALHLESIRLLDDALWVTDAEEGYLAVPVREGLLVPADSGIEFTHRFDTFAYEGCHMEMLGVVKRGAAALLTWHDPYVALDTRSALTNAPSAAGRQLLSTSVVLRKSAKSLRIQFLGRGDYGTIAQAYQKVAQEKGWRVPWEQKLRDYPERAKLFGAINFKLWSVLDRSMNEASTAEQHVRVHWTFDEAAQVAEHLKNDLHLDKVLFIMGGWIHRGYDNQHPDILPTAPECGGDSAFAECARRVRALGYLFCLHDNYQDIYRDSPSWDEGLVMKQRDGSLARGGHWAGGVAFLTCSEKALELAQRPQNLPAVKKLSHADAYFIDTTYAAGLQECFDPRHPLTRADDMRWKIALSDYSRALFGIFGSECGREWAIPHSDFFEGLTGVSGHFYHDAGLLKKVGGTVIPLFEMVYRDTIALYGKYGYDINQSAEYVLHHLIIGRPLHHHDVPSHLYWKDAAKASQASPTNTAAIFTRADQGWAEGLHPSDRFVKNTAEILSPLNELTAQVPLSSHAFLSSDRKVQRSVFGSGATSVTVTVNARPEAFECESHRGGRVRLPAYGFLIESPTLVAFLAEQWQGLHYPGPVLFTLRSLDGRRLDNSTQIRVFHGFGDARLRWANREWVVEREQILVP